MNRRGFLGTLFAPIVARYVPPSVFRWKRVGPTIGAIDRATFHFWRNQHVSDTAYWLNRINETGGLTTQNTAYWERRLTDAYGDATLLNKMQ